MMPRENCVDNLRDHGVVVAVHARKKRLTLLHPAQEILAQLLPQGSIGKALLGPIAAAAKLTKSFRLRSHEGPDSRLDTLLK
jgi:hypothetical protein